MREEFIDIPKMSSKLPFFIHFAGISYCDKSYHIYRPNSPTSCFEYILSGKGTLKTQGKTYYPQKGDTYVCYPGDTQEYYSDPDDPWVKIWFNGRGSLINSLAESYGIRNHSVFHCSGEKYIRNIHSVLQNKELSPLQMSQETSIILHQLIQFLSNNIDNARSHSDEAIVLRNYIDTHLCTNITIDELCRLIHKSPAQTIRIFKNNYNKTPYDYHLGNKLRKATSLLELTTLSVKEISFFLGFCDEHYFSGIFKQKQGITPTEYRIRYIQNQK